MKPRQRILVAHDESTFNSTRLWKKNLGTDFSHLDRTTEALKHGTGSGEYCTSQMISQRVVATSVSRAITFSSGAGVGHHDLPEQAESL